MAGRFGSPSVTIVIDDGPGGSGQTFTTFVTGEVAAEIIAHTEEVTAMGDASKKFAPTGLLESPAFTVSGPWDTTGSTGPHVVLLAPDNGPQDATRTVVLTYGDSKVFTVESILIRYKVSATVNGLSTFEGEFLPAQVGTWA